MFNQLICLPTHYNTLSDGTTTRGLHFRSSDYWISWFDKMFGVKWN